MRLPLADPEAWIARGETAESAAPASVSEPPAAARTLAVPSLQGDENAVGCDKDMIALKADGAWWR